MSIMERITTSEKRREQVSGVWLLFVLIGGVCWLHFGTDFNVADPAWYRYLFEVVRVERTAPVPYIYMIPGIFVAYWIGILIARITWRRVDYGDAKDATKRDLKTMKLFGKDNIVIGDFNGTRIIPEGVRHSLVVAGTGSGKTQGIAIPTLHNYQGSAVVLDPKGELWETTSGHRSTFSDCYRLEWTSSNTARYNPISLQVLPDDPREIELRVGQIAEILGPAGKDYFDKDALKALRALMLLEIFDARHEGRDTNLGNVAHFAGELKDYQEVAEEEGRSPLNIKFYEASERAEQREYPRSVVSDLGEFAGMSSRQLTGVMGTLGAEIQVLKMAAIETAISACDIDSSMLVSGKRPVTVYIVVKPNDAKLTSTLTTTFITNMVLDLVSRTSSEAKAGHNCLFLVEEFSALKKTPALAELFDRGRGLGLQGLIVVQSFSQIREIYGEDGLKTFINNSDLMVIFAVTDADTQRWLENVVGKTTRRRESRSQNDRGGDSTSVSQEGVPLILAQEWGEIKPGNHIVLTRYYTTRPVRAKTRFAYNDAVSAKRMKKPEPPRIAVSKT